MTIELRKFGLMMAGILSLFFGLLLPLLLKKPVPLILWEISAFFLFFAWVKPGWLKPIYITWMKIGHVLGWINTRIILGIIFFVLITPIGLIIRVLGNDPMQKRYDKNVSSYRKKVFPQPIRHMEKPF